MELIAVPFEICYEASDPKFCEDLENPTYDTHVYEVSANFARPEPLIDKNLQPVVVTKGTMGTR
jgi:hypothetical protein